MAWEELASEKPGMTGDGPSDEMASALKNIRREYLERWGRNPYFSELLYVLQATVDVAPSEYVADSRIPTFERLAEVEGIEPAYEHIDPGDYEAALDGESEDFLINPTDEPLTLSRETVVVRGEVIEKSKRRILCRYTILRPSITDVMAQSLIRSCVLDGLLDYDLNDVKVRIKFERRT